MNSVNNRNSIEKNKNQCQTQQSMTCDTSKVLTKHDDEKIRASQMRVKINNLKLPLTNLSKHTQSSDDMFRQKILIDVSR